MSNPETDPKPETAPQQKAGGDCPSAPCCASFYPEQTVWILSNGEYHKASFVERDCCGVATVRMEDGKIEQVWDCNIYDAMREPELGEWLGPVGVKAMEDAAACYASLGACMKHHDEQSEVRKRHAAETSKAVEELDYKTFDHPTMDYQDYRDWNLRQAAFDAEWGDRHKEWADAIRSILQHNVESIRPESKP